MMDVLPWACRRPRCAAEPCPPTLSAGRSAGPTCITDPPARSADSPSRGSPGSASPPSVRWNQSTQEVRYFKNRWPRITALVEVAHLSWMFFLTIRKYDLMSLSMTSQSLCSRAVNFLDTGTGWRRTKKKNQNRMTARPTQHLHVWIYSTHHIEQVNSVALQWAGWERGLCSSTLLSLLQHAPPVPRASLGLLA